eukprot:8456156-Alexandrium_andersonii.AAC.1
MHDARAARAHLERGNAGLQWEPARTGRMEGRTPAEHVLARLPDPVRCRTGRIQRDGRFAPASLRLSLIHISEPTRLALI